MIGSYTQKESLTPKKKAKLTVFELVLFSMLGALMFGSKMLMEFLPNVHLLGMFIVTFTAVFRFKALIPIYIYVLLNGVLAGFAPWWIPYLYVWTVLWGMAMLIPKNIPDKVANLKVCRFQPRYIPCYHGEQLTHNEFQLDIEAYPEGWELEKEQPKTKSVHCRACVHLYMTRNTKNM